MKYAIDLGHGVSFDGGAVGLVREEFWINQVGKLLIDYLKQLGHEVIECRPKTAINLTNSLQQRCDRANFTDCDVFVSLHANKFNGKAHGTEVYAISTAGRKIAVDICKKISDLGFHGRGVKADAFFVLRKTKMPAVLVEMAFIDAKRDVDLFDATLMAKAICEGLTGETPADNICRS